MTMNFESVLLFCCSQAHSMCLLPLCRTKHVKLVDMNASEAGIAKY